MINIDNKINHKSFVTKLSQKWLDVLVPFSYEYDKRFSGVEISRISGIPQKTVSRYLNNLVLGDILRVDKSGTSNFYYLDSNGEKFNVILDLVESYKSFLFSANNFLWKDLKDFVQFGTVILFGSYAKGCYTKESDIDLLIFSRKTEKLKRVLRENPRVQAHIISFDSFEKLVFEKNTLALEILNNHVIFGEKNKFIGLCRRFYGR